MEKNAKSRVLCVDREERMGNVPVAKTKLRANQMVIKIYFDAQHLADLTVAVRCATRP